MTSCSEKLFSIWSFLPIILTLYITYLSKLVLCCCEDTKPLTTEYESTPDIVFALAFFCLAFTPLFSSLLLSDTLLLLGNYLSEDASSSMPCIQTKFVLFCVFSRHLMCTDSFVEHLWIFPLISRQENLGGWESWFLPNCVLEFLEFSEMVFLWGNGWGKTSILFSQERRIFVQMIRMSKHDLLRLLQQYQQGAPGAADLDVFRRVWSLTSFLLMIS